MSDPAEFSAYILHKKNISCARFLFQFSQVIPNSKLINFLKQNQTKDLENVKLKSLLFLRLYKKKIRLKLLVIINFFSGEKTI